MSNVNAVEATWLAINVFSALVTLGNLLDAFRDWRAVADLSKERPQRIRQAWRIQARANVRREVVELVIVAGLLVLVLPALLQPGDTPMSLFLVVFMAVPVGIALNSYLDARTRRTLSRLVIEAG